MATLAVGAGWVALGYFLAGLGNTQLSNDGYGTSYDLFRTSQWVFFAGFVVILAGVASAGWLAFLDQRWEVLGELGAAVVATLLITVGTLEAPTASTPGKRSGAVVTAVGVGLWALLLAYRAGRASVAEHRAPTLVQPAPDLTVPDQPPAQLANAQPASELRTAEFPSRPPTAGISPEAARAHGQAPLWGIAALAVLAVAVGTGLAGSQSSSVAPRVVAGAFAAVGFAGLLVCISIGRSWGALVFGGFANVAGGLLLLALAGLGVAVAYAVVLGPNGTLTGVRVGTSIPDFIAAAGAGLLGVAALVRTQALWARPLVRLEGADPTSPV